MSLKFTFKPLIFEKYFSEGLEANVLDWIFFKHQELISIYFLLLSLAPPSSLIQGL